MYQKIVAAILVITLLNLFGCYSFHSVTVNEYKQFELEEGTPGEVYVKTKNNRWYHFINYNYYIENDTLRGSGKVLINGWQNAPNSKIALCDIEYIGVEEMNMYTTSLLVAIGILGALGIIFAFIWLFTSDKTIKPY